MINLFDFMLGIAFGFFLDFLFGFFVAWWRSRND